jgi:hypothetical protein
MSFDVILPFLQPIAHLMTDPDVTEIMVNAGGAVFVERVGRVTALPAIRMTERDLQVATRNIARVLGDDISVEKPLLDSRLPDGSRVAAVWPPCSVGGTTLTIRRFRYRTFTIDELMRVGTIAPDVVKLVRQAIHDRENILISGGTSTGKTTLLNALAAFVPDDDRIVVIEDTAELRLDKPIYRASRLGESSQDCQRSRSGRSSTRASGIGRIAFSWVRCAAAKRTTCCRPSTPVTAGRSAPSTRIRPLRRSHDSQAASYSRVWTCRMGRFGTKSQTRCAGCCTSSDDRASAS